MQDILELIRELKRLQLRVGILETLEETPSSGTSTSDKSWSFDSPQGELGTFYFGGFYDFASSDNDFSPSAVNFGLANISYAAHIFVVLGAQAVDEITITVTGTSITDQGVRTGSDTETITIPNGTVVNTYFETTKKWLGTVTLETTAGTAKTCNYGFCKYWDNNNTDFTISGVEATWLGGATDTDPDIKLRYHSPIGWTFNGGSIPTPPTEIASMATDHSTEKKIINNANGAWKRDNLSQVVDVSNGEGTIFEVLTTSNKTFELGNIIMQITE